MTDGRYGWGRQIAFSTAQLHRHAQAAQTVRVFSGRTGIFDILFPLINKVYFDSSLIHKLAEREQSHFSDFKHSGGGHERRINVSCKLKKKRHQTLESSTKKKKKIHINSHIQLFFSVSFISMSYWFDVYVIIKEEHLSGLKKKKLSFSFFFFFRHLKSH